MFLWDFPSGAGVKKKKNPPVNSEDVRDQGSVPGSGKIPWKRKWQPTPVFLPKEFHGQRSLMGSSPWGHKLSDMTEATWQTHTLFWVLGTYGIHHFKKANKQCLLPQ